MQRIMGMARKAITEYDMIQNGDRVAVGVSGGKDSVALTMALHWLRRFIGIDYEVVAITLDPCFGGWNVIIPRWRSCLNGKASSMSSSAPISDGWYLMSGRRQIPAVCVPRCAGCFA